MYKQACTHPPSRGGGWECSERERKIKRESADEGHSLFAGRIYLIGTRRTCRRRPVDMIVVVIVSLNSNSNAEVFISRTDTQIQLHTYTHTQTHGSMGSICRRHFVAVVFHGMRCFDMRSALSLSHSYMCTRVMITTPSHTHLHRLTHLLTHTETSSPCTHTHTQSNECHACSNT